MGTGYSDRQPVNPKNGARPMVIKKMHDLGIRSEHAYIAGLDGVPADQRPPRA